MLERDLVLNFTGVSVECGVDLGTDNNGFEKKNGDSVPKKREKPFSKEPHVNGRRHPTGGGRGRGKTIRKPPAKNL